MSRIVFYMSGGREIVVDDPGGRLASDLMDALEDGFTDRYNSLLTSNGMVIIMNHIVAYEVVK